MAEVVVAGDDCAEFAWVAGTKVDGGFDTEVFEVDRGVALRHDFAEGTEGFADDEGYAGVGCGGEEEKD